VAFVETGAARLREQKHSTPDFLSRIIMDIIENPHVREQMQQVLSFW
jgi:hypothetical protein